MVNPGDAGAVERGTRVAGKRVLACGYRYSAPLENADLVGIELTQDVHRVVFPELCNDSEPYPILQQMLDTGRTGMNSGQGFHHWTPETAAAKRELLTKHLLKVTART